MAVYERRVHCRPDRQLEPEHGDRGGQDCRAGEDQPPLQQDARRHRQDEESDRRREQQGQRVIGDGYAVDAGGGHQPAGGAAAGLRLPAGPSPFPDQQQQEEERHQGEVEHVRVGVRREPPEEIGPGQEETCRQGDPAHPGQELDDCHGAGHSPGGQDRLQQVHAERRLAERLEDARGNPAQDHVRRVAGGVGCSHHRADGLELGGVPAGDAGRKSGDDEPECHRGRQERREGGQDEVSSPAGTPQPGRGGTDPRGQRCSDG